MSSIVHPYRLQMAGILSTRGDVTPASQFWRVFRPICNRFAASICERFALILAALMVTCISSPPIYYDIVVIIVI